MGTETITGFKGFDKDLKCKDKQYAVDKTFSEKVVDICHAGMHFCESPFDVFGYYAPGDSRYCEVKGGGKTERHNEDSKIACSKLHVGAEIGLKGMIEAGLKFNLEKVTFSDENSTTGDQSGSQATGDQSGSQATGNRTISSTNGDYSYSIVAEGVDSVAMATGRYAKAKAALGCWIVLADWAEDEDRNWHITDVKSVRADGETIKADTFYMLACGEFVEVE